MKKITNESIKNHRKYFFENTCIASIELFSTDRPDIDQKFFDRANKLSIEDESVQRTIANLTKSLEKRDIDFAGAEWVLIDGVNGIGVVYIDLCLCKPRAEENEETK